MTAHEKEKVIKYGYEKYKKRNYKECIIDLLYNFASIGLFGIPFCFFSSKIISVKWGIRIGIALLIIVTILDIMDIIYYKRKIKDYKDYANGHWLNVTRFGNDYEIRLILFDEYVMVTLSDEEVKDLLHTEIV